MVGNRIRQAREEGGQAVVELAFVLPIVLLILFAIVDFGLALNQQNSDTNIANLAARQVSVLGASSSLPCKGRATAPTTLLAWVQCEVNVTGARPVSSVCVMDSSGGNYAVGDAETVEIKSNFGWLKMLTGSVNDLSSTLNSSATMRVEQAAGSNTFLSPVCPAST